MTILPSICSEASNGWFIDLDSAGTFSYDGVARIYDAERVITNPLSTTTGNIFFTTFKPYSDTCSIGGKSFIWAVRYDSGCTATDLQGTALIQVSTGSIEQKNLELDSGREKVRCNGRRSSYRPGPVHYIAAARDSQNSSYAREIDDEER